MVIIIYLFLEIYLSVTIASEIGALATFLEVIVSALLGAFFLKSFQHNSMNYLQSLSRGEMSLDDFQKFGVYTLIGSILLIIPGFLTDILGLLLQFSGFGKIFASKIIKPKHNANSFNKEDEIIDVEVIERSESVKEK